MNEREFYKKLMKTYTVDIDKIKCNAKRKIPTSVKMIGVYRRSVGFAACAAAAAITVTALSFFYNKGGVDIKEPDSSIERFYAAEARFAELSSKYDTMDMYVSFRKELSLNEILIAFSAADENGRIKISLLYTEGGKCYKNNGALGDNLMFLGAKITASATLSKDIKALKCIALAEPVEGSKYNDKSFIPYSGDDEEKPAATIDAPLQIVLPDVTEALTEVSSIQSAAVTESAEQTSFYESASSEKTEPDKLKPIQIPISGVKEARFISENSLIVLTDEGIMLYKLNSDNLSLVTAIYAGSAKLACASVNEDSLFITACDNGTRNKLFYADGKTQSLTAVDISSITSGAEIASVMCSNDGSVMIIKTVSTDKTHFYKAVRNGNTITVTPVKDYPSAAAALTYSNDILYTAVTAPEGAAVTLYGVEASSGKEKTIISMNTKVRCVRNYTLDAAVLIFGEAEGSEDVKNVEPKQYKLLTPSGSLIDIGGAAGEVVFSVSNASAFKIGDKYYIFDGKTVNEIKSADAKELFIQKKNPVSKYSIEISEDAFATVITA